MIPSTQMSTHDYRDLVGGGLLFAIGLGFGLHAVSSMDIGDLRRLGPGSFPVVLGFLLASLGAAIAIPAWARGDNSLPSINWRALGSVSLGVLAFAFTIGPFGMVPAIFLLTIFAVRSDGQFGPRVTLLLATVLAALAYLVFGLGLGLMLQPFRWPF
jgi:hypothetical protein